MCARIKGESAAKTLSFALFVHSGECSFGNGYCNSYLLARIKANALETAKAYIGNCIFRVVLDVKLNNVLGGILALVLSGNNSRAVLYSTDVHTISP